MANIAMLQRERGKNPLSVPATRCSKNFNFKLQIDDVECACAGVEAAQLSKSSLFYYIKIASHYATVHYFLIDCVELFICNKIACLTHYHHFCFFSSYFAFLLCSINLPIVLFRFTHFALSFTHFAYQKFLFCIL